ncbi:MAG: MerR family transcriptional regulator [Pseudorhodoplanes sp.]|nr:MerR family transcriptional regulator [Pseudorhodoplanes sp.]
MDKAPDAFRTISEVADDLKVPQHVLRFWESRFAQIKPMKRAGGRRYYRPDDVDLLRGIHHLLYGEGYTIRGVQRILKDQGIKFVEQVWQAGAEQPPHGPHYDSEDSEVHDQAPRGRLFDRLQSLTGRSNAHHEPVDENGAAATADEGQAELSREELRKLQTTLFELGECRRLLDAALVRKDD